MQLKLIQAYIESYKAYLKTPAAKENLHLWESQANFQQHWDPAANDWKTMYDQSLQNSQTRRLWKRESYDPKDMMLKFIELQPEYVKQMFHDLYNEEKDIEGRVSRFVFYCDQLLQEYKDAYPHSIENNHYHDDDYGMVSVYLAFRFPEKYTLYRKDSFIGFLKKVNAIKVSPANDFERFVKVTRTLASLLRKDEKLLALHAKRFKHSSFFNPESNLLVFDYYTFVAS